MKTQSIYIAMRITSVTVAVMLGAAMPSSAAVLANYTFTGGSATSSDSDVNSTAGTFGDSGLSASFATFQGQEAIRSAASDMPTSLSTVDYFTFTVTESGGNFLNLSGTGALTFQYGRTASAFSWAVRSSVDSFAADIATGSAAAADTWNNASINLSSSFDTLTSVEFRILVWDGGANGNGSHGYLDNVVLNGLTTPIPEPMNISLVAFAVGLVGVGLGRRFLRSKKN
jgi:hypothetical protein